MKFKRQIIPFSLIKRSASLIGKNLHPEKIILFGSYAYGEPKLESDVDMLVVFKKGNSSSEQYAKVSKVIEPRPFPVDILVRTDREIEHRLKIGDTFMREILEKGKVLYES